MPPKGESIGYCLEDAILFSRVLFYNLSHFSHFSSADPARTIFSSYERIRRKPIEEAYRTASTGWMSNRDMGVIGTKLFEWFTPVFLWWTRTAMERDFMADPRDVQLPEL